MANGIFTYGKNIFEGKSSLKQQVTGSVEFYSQSAYDLSASLQITQQPIFAADTVTKVQPPTKAQIRYWQWQREKNLVVGDSRYMEPRGQVKLGTEVPVTHQGLGLPAHKREKLHTDWLTILLLLILVLFASVRTYYSKYLVHLFQSLVNYSTAFRMFREKNYSGLHAAFRLELFFYITFSVLIFQIINYSNINFEKGNITLYLVCLGGVFAYFFIKKLVYNILGSVFSGVNETREYLFNMDNFNRVTGMFLFPIVILITFYPAKNPSIPVLAGGITVFVFYILLLQRGITILMKKQFSIFYLFLYLCSLEFLPLLLIYKIVVV